MKRCYLLFVLLLLLNCKESKNDGERPMDLAATSDEVLNKPAGIGLLEVNTEFPIPIYQQESDGVPIDTLKFMKQTDGTLIFVTKLKMLPYQMWGGDALNKDEVSLPSIPPKLVFKVVDTTKISFKIITDETKDETYFVKRNPSAAYYVSVKTFSENICNNCSGKEINPNWYLFQTWERYLKNVFYVTNDLASVYNKPNGKILFNTGKASKPYQVMEVKGEWIKITDDPYHQKEVGWLQWKKGDEILIDITDSVYF